VFASSHIDDDQARDELLRKNPKIPPDRTRVVRFRSGRYARHWVGNVFAVGNASGFVEPLEATALAVILGQVCTLANCLEDCALQPTPTVRDVANRYLNGVWDDVRDFLAVHYRFNTRLETKFWHHCRNETPLGHADEIVKFYRENGPASYGKTVLLGQNNPNNWDGFIAMLVGQQVPHNRPYSPSNSERMLWQKRVEECRRMASRAFTPTELTEVVRRPGWQWWPQWEMFS
jgi:tryptophan halogenase